MRAEATPPAHRVHAMSHRFFPLRRVLTAVALALPLLGTLGAAAATPPPSAAPDLSVSLASDADAVAAGDDLTYTAEIVNRGEAVDARIVLEPPTFVELLKVGDGGTLADNVATWTSALPAKATTTVTVTATVADIPGTERRATALVSVYVNGATTPLIRSASADRIAGVDDEPSTTPESQGMPPWALTAIGVVLAIAAVVIVVVVLRRRRPADADAVDTTADDPATDAAESEYESASEAATESGAEAGAESESEADPSAVAEAATRVRARAAHPATRRREHDTTE